jgi:AAA+ ATPase superfamily predicted ATPase
MIENPFQYGAIVRGPFFADRKPELSELAREMASLSRVFLVSPRRYGKTSLLANLLDRLKEEGLATAYIDLHAYPDLRSFAAGFAQTTSMALETSADRLIKMFAGMQRLRPRVTAGMDGEISAGLEMAPGEKEAIPALIEGMRHAEGLARRKKKKLVIVIDEFSDLEKFDGRAVEKAFRSEVQQQTAVGYVFSGSEEPVMLSMVKDKKRAFYRLGRIMELGPIPREDYLDFLCGWFRKGGYALERGNLANVLDAGRDVPYNVQRLCHVLWDMAQADRKVTPSRIQALPSVVAKQDSPHFELLWHTATAQQRALLFALSKEPGAKPFSKDFQLAHGIGPSSSIKASLDSLVKKAILYRTKEGTYAFSDVFMQYWILSVLLTGYP